MVVDNGGDDGGACNDDNGGEDEVDNCGDDTNGDDHLRCRWHHDEDEEENRNVWQRFQMLQL